MAGSPADRELVKHLDSLTDESDTRRDETGVRDAELNLRFLRGAQWPDGGMGAPGRSQASNEFRFVMNVLNTAIKRKTALITDTRPNIDVMSRGSLKWRNSAAALKAVCHAIWDYESLDQATAREIVRAATIGATCAVPVWNPQARGQRGDIEIKFYDPRQIAFDPSVTNARDMRDAEYFQTRDVLPVNWIKENYPTRGNDVEPTDRWSTYTPKRAARSGFTSVLTAMARPWRRDKQEVIDSATPRTELRHSWFKDWPRNEKGEPLFGSPRILRHTVDASGVILMDEPMPYSHKGIPAHLFSWDIELDHPFGMSEVGGLRRLQYTLNRIIGQVMDNVIINNRVRVTADTDAVDNTTWQTITKNPNGLYVKKRMGRSFEFRNPENVIPPFVLDFIKMLIEAVDLVTGISDAASGRRPSGVTSGLAIEGLQLAAQTLVRLEARAFEDWLERIFNQVIPLVWQYYTSDRVLAILGPGNQYKQFEFQRKVLLRDDDDELMPEEAWQDFVFRVIPGSSLASSRIQRGVLAMNLHKAGLISGLDVLRAADWPDPETTYSEAMEEAKEKAAQGVQVAPERKHRATQGPIPVPGAGATMKAG